VRASVCGYEVVSGRVSASGGMCVCTHTHICISMLVCTCMYVQLCIYVYLYVHVSICVYLSTHTHKHTRTYPSQNEPQKNESPGCSLEDMRLFIWIGADTCVCVVRV